MAFLPPIGDDSGQKVFECTWAVNESPYLGGDVMLYYAASCKGRKSMLEASGGARSGELSVISSALDPNQQQPMKIATIIAAEGVPDDAIERWAKDSMQADGSNPAEIAKCKARREPSSGFDAWVVDEYPLGGAPVSTDGPRYACGTYGYTGDSVAYWRAFNGEAWFFEMGQDAYLDVDPNSITILTKTATGWAIAPVVKTGPVQTAAAKAMSPVNAGPAAPAPAPAPKPPGGSFFGAPANAPQRQPAPAPAPAPQRQAQATPNYGGVRIANAPGSAEQYYGEARGWYVYSGSINSAFKYCAGERNANGEHWRLGYDGGQWQIALPFASKDGEYGGIEIDGRGRGLSFESDGTWTFGSVDAADMGGIKAGNLMILDVGKVSVDLALIGTAALATKIEECVRTQGRAPVRTAAPAPAQQPRPVRQQQQFQQPAPAPHDSVFDGSWVWAPKWHGKFDTRNTSRLTLLPNDEVQYCYNQNPCMTVKLTATPDGGFNFTTDGKNYFEFLSPEPGLINGRFWADFNTPGAPDATIKYQN